MSVRKITVQAAFGKTPTSTIASGDWIDLSSRLREATWQYGRNNELDEFPAGTATVRLLNRDRHLDPDYASSPYVGQLLPYVPVRLQSITPALITPGTSGAYARTLDHSSLDITGDIDLRAEAVTTDWTPAASETFVSKWNVTGDQRSYLFQVTSSGNLRLITSPDGSEVNAILTDSTTAVTPPASGRLAVRVTLDVASGANKVTNFYTASTIAGPWTQLGTTITVAGNTSILSSTANVEAGASSNGTIERFTGKIRAVQVRSGIDGTLVANPDFTAQMPGTTSFFDSLGRQWTVLGAASIAYDTAGVDDEFYGFVQSGWQQELAPKGASECQIDLVDMLGVMSGYKLPDVFEQAVLAHNPVGFWVLDSADSEQVVDLGSGRNHGTVTGDGVTLGDRVITPGHRPAARFDVEVNTGTTDLDTEQNRYGSVYMGASPIIGTDASSLQNALLMVTFLARKPPANEATTTAELRVLFTQGNGTTGWQKGNGLAAVIIQPANQGQTPGMLTYGVQSVLTATTLQSVTDGRPHLMFGSNETLALDSATLSIPQAFGYPLPKVNGVAIGGGPGLQPQRYFDGWVGAAALFTSATTVGVAGRQAILDAYSKLNGQTSDTHIEWALDAFGVPAGTRNLDVGSVLMGPADAKDKDALQWMQEVTATEGGELYVDHRDGGKIRFVNRYGRYLNARSTTSQATFSDDPAATNTIEYSASGLDIASNALDGIINQATVQWAGGDVTVSDAASIAANGPHAHQIQTTATTAAAAQSVAEWVIARYKNPRSRIRGVTVGAKVFHRHDENAQRLRIDDRVTFRVHPLRVGTATTVSLFVDGVSHSARGIEWSTSFRLAPVDTYTPWIWGTSQWDTQTFWG